MAELIGAHLSGWSAQVVQALMSRHLRQYLPQMTPEQRDELRRTHRSVCEAAAWWLASGSASAQALLEQVDEESKRANRGDQEITTAEAADLLRVSTQRIRQLAPSWEAAGLARKVGRVWLVDRSAVDLYNVRRAA